jgi:hypothetical protein
MSLIVITRYRNLFTIFGRSHQPEGGFPNRMADPIAAINFVNQVHFVKRGYKICSNEKPEHENISN